MLFFLNWCISQGKQCIWPPSKRTGSVLKTLSNANLWKTIGNSKELITLPLGDDNFKNPYHINYTNSYLQIGYRSYTFDEWLEFSDDDILEMDGQKGLKFWNKPPKAAEKNSGLKFLEFAATTKKNVLPNCSEINVISKVEV